MAIFPVILISTSKIVFALRSDTKFPYIEYDKINKLLFGNALSPLFTIYDMFYIIKVFYRKIAKRRLASSSYTQKELNEIFENPKPIMIPKYCYLLQTFMLTFLLSYISPITALVALLGLVFHYFVEVYRIVNIYSKPDHQSSILTFECISYLHFFLLVGYYYTNTYYFSFHFNNWVEYPIMITLGLTWLWPYKKRFNKYFLFFDPEVNNDARYSEEFLKCKYNYSNINPSLYLESIQKYHKILVDLKLTTEEKLEKLLEEEENLRLNPTKLYHQLIEMPYTEQIYGVKHEQRKAIKIIWSDKELNSINRPENS